MTRRRRAPARNRKPYEGPPPQLDLFSPPKRIVVPPPLETSVVPTDREPILREWRKKYRTLENELAELSKKSEDYHFQAVPAFQAWVARTFGEELSGIREIEEKLREAELIALATAEEARATDSPESEAYQAVLLRKERGEDLFPSADDWDEGWEEVDPERDYRAEAKEERLREEPHERKSTPDDDSREYFRELEAEKNSRVKDGEGSRIKALYRKLAFALHPDANPNQTERERKIWDEVQIAYAERDLERLEMLQAWTESGSENWLERLTHLGTLRTLILEKVAEVRSSHLGFNRLRKAAPWKYWSARELPEKIEVVRQNLEEEFVRDFLTLQRRLREFELHFRRLGSNLSGRPRKRRRR